MAVVDGDDMAEGDRLRPVLFGDAPHRCGGQVERLVPGDPLPARIGIALRAGAAQGMRQPIRVVDELGCGAALGAERLAGRMRGVGVEPDEAAVLDGGDRAAARDAQAAIGVDALLGGSCGHRVPLAAI